MCALREAKPGNREPAESKKASPSDWFKEQPFTRGSGDAGQGAGEGRGRMQGRREGGKPTPQSFIFLSSLTRQLFHGIHKIHLSREAPGGNRGRKGGRERERERV